MWFYHVQVLSFKKGKKQYTGEEGLCIDTQAIEDEYKCDQDDIKTVISDSEISTLDNELRHAFVSGTAEEKKYNDAHQKEYVVSYSNRRTADLSLCIAAKTTINPETVAKEYLALYGIEANKLSFREISTQEYSSDLEERFGVYRSELLNNIIDQAGVRFQYCRFHDAYQDSFLDELPKQTIYSRAKEWPTYKTLKEELDRVYVKTNSKIQSHPVHYVFYTKHRDVRKESYRLLLSALYSQKRLQNKRYSFVELDKLDYINDGAFYDFYKANIGGAIVVRISNTTEKKNTANNALDALENFAYFAKLFQHEVLTIFCVGLGDAIAKNVLNSKLSGMVMVEIEEKAIDYHQAKHYLKNQAAKDGFKTDKTLYAQLGENEYYEERQLKLMYKEWETRKLKNDYFPQYSALHEVTAAEIEKEPEGDGYNELEELIGLKKTKELINKVINYAKMRALYNKYNIKVEMPALNMAFLGNPGTAKTTVARILAKILYQNGVLKNNVFVETGRADLVAQYLGQTAPKVVSAYNKAEGGILFIDEAYSLVDDKRGMYGDEAINTIVQQMENKRNSVITIMAGYPDEMREFIERNPGLQSRINFIVNFDNYSEDELCEISSHLAEKQGLKIEEDAYDKLSGIYKEAMQSKCFGNGRYARNVVEQARLQQAQRIAKMDPETLTKETLLTLKAEDFTEHEELEAKKTKIGF